MGTEWKSMCSRKGQLHSSTWTHTHKLILPLAHIHTVTHTHIHTYRHTHTHTHTHTHRQTLPRGTHTPTLPHTHRPSLEVFSPFHATSLCSSNGCSLVQAFSLTSLSLSPPFFLSVSPLFSLSLSLSVCWELDRESTRLN